MQVSSFVFPRDDGANIFVRQWMPDGSTATKAIVHIAHGMAEHAERYARLAEALTGSGYAVYANDHRGHGKTAPSDADLGYFADRGGWNACVQDLAALVEHEKSQHPDSPLVLLGHSMGSLMTQQFLFAYGGKLAGAVLSGSGGKPPTLAAVGRLVARVERFRLGAHGRSRLLSAMSFGDFNKRFAPNRTDFDWLSRDDAEVDAYVADPHCGFDCTTQMWIDVLDALPRIANPANQARIPSDLPVYILSGDRDPVSDNTKALHGLLDAYRRAGLTRVQHRFYPGGRHEMFNETNRDEVRQDLLTWLDSVVVDTS